MGNREGETGEIRARHPQLHHVAYPRQGHLDRGDGAPVPVLSRGLRFRKNDKRYPGHPDIVLPKWHTVVFVNGCFWHMHEGCAKHSMPKSNVDFWSAKLLRNRERDRAQHAALEAMGWRVIVVWECELAKPVRQERLERLYTQIAGGDTTPAVPTGAAS